MNVFNTIEPMARPDGELRGDIVIKKVAKKDISREEDEETKRKFIPVFMDDMNR